MSKFKTIISDPQPSNFAIVDINNRNDQYSHFRQRIVAGTSYLTKMKIRVLSGDIRLPHACIFFLLNSQSIRKDDQFKVSALSTDSNYVECRVPFEFQLIGRLQMAVLVNEESYSNFVEIHTYNLVDIIQVSPQIIHGTHHLFPVDITVDKDHGVDLPEKMKVQIDNDFFDAIKLPYNINLEKATFRMNIELSFHSKLHQTQGLTYTFNQQDFFSTNAKLIFMPDIIIQELSPKQAPLLKTISAKVYALNVNFENKYWCLTDDGQLTEAILKKEIIPNHNMERIFIYCNLQIQYFPRKLHLSILSNSGTSITNVNNFIDYKFDYLPVSPYEGENFFKIATITERAIVIGTSNSISIPIISYINIEKSKLITQVSCIFNETITTLGKFQLNSQSFNCSLPSLNYSYKTSSQLAIKINDRISLGNKAQVLVYPQTNIKTFVRYYVLQENQEYSYYESMKSLQQSTFKYLEYCEVQVTIQNQSITMISDFNHNKWYCQYPQIRQQSVIQSIDEFNRINKIELLKNATLINILRVFEKPQLKLSSYVDNTNLISVSIDSRIIKSTDDTTDWTASFNKMINKFLFKYRKALIKSFRVLDNGQAFALQLFDQGLLNSDFSLKCQFQSNIHMDYVDHSQTCISNFQYMNLMQLSQKISLIERGQQISNEIQIPVLYINKVYLVKRHEIDIFTIQGRTITLRIIVDATFIPLLKSINKENINIILDFNELSSLKISASVQTLNLITSIELYQEIQQAALDINFSIQSDFLFMLLSDYSELNKLTMNLRILLSKAIVTQEFNDRFYFNQYQLLNQPMIIRPQIIDLVYLEKTDVTIIELSKTIPPGLQSNIRVKITSSKSISEKVLNLTQITILESRISIPQIRNILESLTDNINSEPHYTFFEVLFINQEFSVNKAKLFFDGTLKPDPFKYLKTIDTSYIERDTINITEQSKPQKFNKNLEPIQRYNFSYRPVLQESNQSVNINFTEFEIKREQQIFADYLNLTDLLLRDNQTVQEPFQPFEIKTNEYQETQSLKKINISFIETQFISIKDNEQTVISFNKPKLIDAFNQVDSLFKYSQPGNFDLSTQCTLYRLNETMRKEIFNESLWNQLLDLSKLNILSGDQLLEQIIVDDSDYNQTQISFVFQGKLKINKTQSWQQHLYKHLILNDTQWYRNTSIDEQSTYHHYKLKDSNKEVIITRNQSQVLITNDMLTKIDQFLNIHEEYQEYLKQLQLVKSSDSTYFNQFKIYANLYGRLRPLDGLSNSASYFETSPIPGVYGSFSRFVNSQRLLFDNNKNLTSRFNDSLWIKNASLVFAQEYRTLNFSFNETDPNPPVHTCPVGFFIVQSNQSESGYVCQSYPPEYKSQSHFINLTLLTAKVEDPKQKDPIVIESGFFKQNPFLSSSQKIIVSGQKEQLILTVNDEYMTYDDFAALNLTCRIFNTENLNKVAHQTPCYYASPNLNVISLEVKPYKLRQGTYRIQFILSIEDREILSEIHPGFTLEVLLNPQLFAVYPKTFIFLNSVENQLMFLVGRGFTYLKSVEGRLFCKLKFEGRGNGEIQSVTYIEAIIINDFIVQCSFNENARKNKALVNFKRAPLVPFQLSLSVDRKEVTLNSKSMDPENLRMYSVQPASIDYSEPKIITIAQDNQNLDLTVFVSRSSILKERSSEHADIDYYCQFFQQSVLMAESLVVDIDTQHSNTLYKVTCEMPVINDRFEQGEVKIGLIIKRTPQIDGIPQLDVQITQNLHNMQLMHIPVITNAFPPRIYNLAQSQQVMILGRDFVNSHNLICLLRQSIKVKAIFESNSQLICRFKGQIDLSQPQDLPIQISNDNGNTYSQPHVIQIVRNIPQFRILLSPSDMKSNNKYHIQIEGMNLRQATHIGIKIQQGSYEQFSYCNVSMTDENICNCFDLFFPVSGIYSTFLIPDMDRTQQIRGVLKIRIEQFNQASFSFPYSLPIVAPVKPIDPQITPPTIISVEEKLVSISNTITIKGLAFRNEESYRIAFLPNIQKPVLQFTRAEVMDAETLKWNFKYIHSSGLISCGQLLLRDSKGDQYQAKGQRNIEDSTICFIHDLKIDDISLASFPFSFVTLGYHIDLNINDQTFEDIQNNKVLQSKILNVELEFEGISKTSCQILYSEKIIRCGVAFNDNRNFKRVRLWLVINSIIKFDIRQMYLYYDYLHITSSQPDSNLIHLTNKEIHIQTNYLVNSQSLSCVIFGDNIRKLISQAIYISPTEMMCPLSHLVFENTHVTLHITNDINYFAQVNQTNSGKAFNVLQRLKDNLNLTAINNQQMLNLAKIKQDMEIVIIDQQRAHYQLMVTQVQNINLVQQSTNKLLTGPWLTQFSLVVDGLTSGLESMRCVMVYKVNGQIKYQLYSDGISVNKQVNQITCFFKKEILYQANYCIEFNVNSHVGTFQTDKCIAQIMVYHVPTVTHYTSVQGSPNQQLIDTEIIGHYLNHFSKDWLCFFYIFEDHMNTPVKILYNQLPDYVLFTDRRRIECRFSDALYFFSTFKKLEIRGMTNLQDFFYDKTLQFKNKYIDSMFVYSHQVAIVDPNEFSLDNAPNRGNITVQRSLMSQKIEIINHPGDIIGIAGFFLDNTQLGIIAMLTCHSDQSVKLYTYQCVLKSNIFITCQIPSVFQVYNYYTVSLYELDTLQKLNDENILSILVLPRPVIQTTTMDTYVTTMSDDHFPQQMNSQVYKTHYKVKFDPVFNVDFLGAYKQKYLHQTLCRVGSRHIWVKGNLTWSASNELQCTLRNFYNFQPECIEVSINRGRTYTQDCKSNLKEIRAPVVYNFEPKQTMLQKPLIINIAGKDFIDDQIYKCLFHPTKNTSEYLGSGFLNNIVNAIYLNTKTVQCHVPISVQNASNSVFVSIYHRTMKVHTFKDPINYMEYIRVLSLYPHRGTYLGGTPLILEVGQMPILPDYDQSYAPKCQFSLDFLQLKQTYLIDAEVLNRTHILCYTPDISPSFNNYVDVQKDVYVTVNDYDGVFRHENSLLYTFLRDYGLTETMPAYTYMKQQQSITIKGRNLLNIYTLLLKLVFDESGYTLYFRQNLFYVDEETLVIQMPVVEDKVFRVDRRATFYVSLNDGIDWSQQSVDFTFYEEPQMTKLSKYQVNLKGKVPIIVHGIYFRDDITGCLFDNEFARAVTKNSTQISCITKPQPNERRVQVRLMIEDNYIIDTAYLYFDFEKSIQMNQIVPNEGYISGGYNITVYGNMTYFFGKPITVKVGDIEIPKIDFFNRLSLEYIKIRMPAVDTSKTVQIYIIYQDITYTNETVVFYYKTYSSLSKIYPIYGPTNGGTLITVTGDDFDDQVFCYIDYVKVKPVRVSKTICICEAPRHKPKANVPFELTFNDLNYNTSTGLHFSYYQDLQINLIEPLWVSMFAGRNKVKVDIYGWGFMNTIDLKVRLNQDVFPAIFIDHTHLQFYTTDQIQEGAYNIFVANNGEDFQRGSQNVVLNYHRHPGIYELSPPLIQIGPPQITLTVYGYNFPPTIPFYCVFIIPSRVQVNVEAKVISDTHLECLAPTFYKVIDDYTDVQLRVTYNLQEYFGLLNITYYATVKLNDFSEKIFIQSMSQVVLSLSGEHFMNKANELTCVLQDWLDIRQKAFNIYFVDPTHILCSFNMPDTGYYSVLVSNNGIQFINATSRLKVIDSIQVVSIEPKIILSTNKNQIVLVQATHLFQGCQCLFEIKTSEHERVNYTRDFTVGKILNNNLMLCYVPDYRDLGNAVINVRVSYQTYMKAQSNSSVLLTIVTQCPPGFACRADRMMECPLAHYCPGGSMNQTAHLCPIGYYQDKVMSTTCKPCPKGFMCPFRGMSKPVPCPPGHICDKEKLNSPNLQCTKGSYCFYGTQTDDINEFGVFDGLPHKCQIGSYCKPGMKTGVVVFNRNTSTPAPCKRGMVCQEGANDAGGLGPCPSGTYCPRPNITGIPCPPRHYCPERGNTYPIKCPRGTFNMHFGQKNCTICTLGRICPIEGLNMPLNCPPGFVCNKEGLIFPETLCRVGHICLGGVMTGTDNKKRSCFISSTISSCPNGVFYDKALKQFSANKFDTYFYGENVCCMNGTEVHNYLLAMGKATNQKDVFMSYAYMINITGSIIAKKFVHLWDGMRIVDKAAFKQRFNDSDKFPIPVRKHREMILRYFYNMYTTYMQELCPGKSLCLEGVNTMVEGTGLISQPFGCPTGSFCQKGSDSVIGSGLCPIGYYCPPNTQDPIPAPPGRYTGAPGAVEAQICQPGTYADEYRSTECKLCPNGYECKQKETRLPTICPLGMFRSVIQSNVCLACPRGTFNFERGARDMLECLECPPGRICDTEALYNISQTIACTDGQVCATGTGMKLATQCPQGYYCEPQTTPDTVFTNVCDRGFFCRQGTGFSTKNRDTCPQTYYCPPGTGYVVVEGLPSDYTNFEHDKILTRCPQGTGNDGSDTKNRIEQCMINTDHKLLIGDLNIRPAQDASSIAAAAGTSQSTAGGSSGGGFRLLQSGAPVTGFQSSLQKRLQRKSRSLVSQADLKQAELMLKELYEIEFAFGEVKDRVRDIENPSTDTVSLIQDSLNIDRTYIARWCPLNMSLVSEFIEMEKLSEDALQSNIPNVIFDLPASSYAIVTFDLRHVRTEDYRWTYGEDYQISFTIHEELTIEDPSDPVPMPEQFLNNKTEKDDVLEFQILALSNVRLRVDILLFNSLFLNYRHLFTNSTSVEIRTPNRAAYGEYGVFIVSIVQDYEITLPHNIPKLMYDGINLPSHLASLSYSRNDWDPLVHKSIKNRNIWVPSSLYWGDRPRINLNYLPYFSNCKGYGKYIPFWSLMEQHQTCTLIPYNETIWMNEYSFGLKPTADFCQDALIQCIYDERIPERQPNDRWFEVLTGTPIFQVSVEPFLFEDVLERDYDSTEILEVFPAFDGDFTDMIPRAVDLVISYYQVDNSRKRIILAELAYSNFKVMSDDETNYVEKVFYNLTFGFLPLSHKDLTINFAFTSRFYIILYLLVGSIASIITIIFVMYHRIVGRPPLGAKTFASFKFASYMKLTYYPAFQGVMLGLLPIIIGNVFITTVIAGHLMSIDTHLFSCNDPGGDSACIYTLFDLIKDNPSNVSIDYLVLRTGRTGTAFLVMGSYVTLVSLLILVPDKNEAGRVPEAYDGNIWEYFIWKRSNILFTSVFLMFFELAVIQFSFSAIYGDNAWVMMGVFKVIEIIVETMLDGMVPEALMLSPLQVSFAVVLGLTGFGAANFLDFLQGYFIDVGITMFERPYLDSVIEVVQGSLEDSLPKIRRAFAKWIDIKEDDELVKKKDEDEDEFGADEKEEDNKEEEKKEEEEEDSDDKSSASDIEYSDDSSIESNLDDLSLDDDPNILLYQAQQNNDSEIPSVDVSMEMREKKRKDLELKEKRQRDLERHLRGKVNEENAKEREKEFAQYQKQNKNEEEVVEENEEDVKMDDVALQEVEPLIDFYGGYCNDTLSMIYQPFFTGLIWVYYDETVVASLYGIRIQDFIFYFLFNLVIIPFQGTIDIMFQNMQEWYHGLPAHDYADFMAFKFKKRKILWKGNEDQKNNQIEVTLRSLDQMCFSSQYYFIITLCASGFNQIVLGIQILLGQKDYNIFGDMATIPLILFMSTMCIIVHRAAIQVGRFSQIWYVQLPLEKSEIKKDTVNVAELFQKVLEPNKRNEKKGEGTPNEVKFDSYKWLNADRIRVEEDNNMRDLKTDRIVAETFRELFMKHNKPWVQEQIYEIFTPRTLFMHRDKILDQFKKVMGDIKPNLSSDEEGSEKSSKEGYEESDEIEDETKKKRVVKKEELDWVKMNDTPMTRAIIKFWIIRARYKQKVRQQVTHLIDYMRKPYCLYCRTVYGLKVELMQNIEDLFYAFLRKRKADIVQYKIVDWQKYFVKYCSTRTICQDCHREIEIHHMQLKKRLRQIERKRLGIKDHNSANDSDDDDEILDDSVTLEGRKGKVMNKPEYVKKIIKMWILQARLNVKKKKQKDQQEENSFIEDETY